MELSKAIEIIEYFQLWRLGEIDYMKYSPSELTEALNVILKTVKK